MFLRGLGDSTGIPLVDQALSYVQNTAEAQAVPTAVNKIQPYLLASILMGVFGLMLGFSAFRSTRKKAA